MCYIHLHSTLPPSLPPSPHTHTPPCSEQHPQTLHCCAFKTIHHFFHAWCRQVFFFFATPQKVVIENELYITSTLHHPDISKLESRTTHIGYVCCIFVGNVYFSTLKGPLHQTLKLAQSRNSNQHKDKLPDVHLQY